MYELRSFAVSAAQDDSKNSSRAVRSAPHSPVSRKPIKSPPRSSRRRAKSSKPSSERKPTSRASACGPEKATNADAVPIIDWSKHYKPFARQREFHDCGAKYRLFGGAAGPGKTKALLWEAIYQANRHAGVDTLLLRRTFPELESSLIKYFRRDVPRDHYAGYNDTKHIVTWHNGSTTRFGYSSNENDIYQYQGAEFLFIGLDELTHFTLGQWQFLTSRNRCAVPGTTPNMAGASNPGNVGHAWVKALWVDRRAAPGMDRPEQYDPNDYAFIRATLDDNPIYRDDAGYRKTLEALPRHQRQAFLFGDWNVFAGQYFDIFDQRANTARAEELGIQPWWPRWISIDWGFEHPSAVYWHAAAPGGAVVTYREFVANHLSPRMLAQAIVERSQPGASPQRGLAADVEKTAERFFDCAAARPDTLRGHSPWLRDVGSASRAAAPLRMTGLAAGPDTSATAAAAVAAAPERITEIYLSPDAFAHRTSDSSIAEQLGDVFAQNGLPRPVPADDDREGGWMLMYQMLESGTWLIADHCSRLIECLGILVRDPADVEDVQKCTGDDPADSARYGLKSRLAPGRMPAEQRVAERVHSLGNELDATSRAIWMQKFLADERRSRRAAPLPRRW